MPQGACEKSLYNLIVMLFECYHVNFCVNNAMTSKGQSHLLTAILMRTTLDIAYEDAKVTSDVILQVTHGDNSD